MIRLFKNVCMSALLYMPMHTCTCRHVFICARVHTHVYAHIEGGVNQCLLLYNQRAKMNLPMIGILKNRINPKLAQTTDLFKQFINL